MKRFFVAALFVLAVATLHAKDMGVTIQTYTSIGVTETIPAGAKTIMFILSVTSGTGAIGLESSPGSGIFPTITTSDPFILLEAPGDKDGFSAISFRLASGSGVRVVVIQ